MNEQKQWIRPNELRVGNVVSCNEKIVAVSEISKSIAWVESKNILTIVTLENLEGVEITEDVLLKVGFGKTIGFFKTISPNISIELSENNDKSFPQWYCYVRNLNNNSRLDDDFALIRKDLRYLHTLQNMHFDFCDEELDVTKLMEG